MSKASWKTQLYHSWQPTGVFYLFGEGRIRVLRSQPALAIESYEHAMAVQTQYRSLYYISFWEIAICSFGTWEIEKSLKNWRLLVDEATWSKACYTYGAAACLLQLGGEDRVKEAELLLHRIPSLVHKIAGKSIPIEVWITITDHYVCLSLIAETLGYSPSLEVRRS